MAAASSLRGRVCATALLALTLVTLTTHTCAALNAAHAHAVVSVAAHQSAPDHAAAMHGSCCEAMLLGVPARSSDAVGLIEVLLSGAATADTMQPFLETVVAAPALMSYQRPSLLLLHAALRI